jgi:hypothetical protein
VTITNVGHVPIEMVELSVQSALNATTENRIFKWSDENLMTQLPLQPGSSASLTLYLYAATDFVAPSIRNGNIHSNFRVLKRAPFVNNHQFLRCYQ